MTEYQDLIDDNDNVIGKATREEVVEKGLLHRSVVIFVFNSKNEMYLQKRSKNKVLFPGMWGIGAAGGVSLEESYEDAAKRELEEELGIVDVDLTYLFDLDYISEILKCKYKVYKCTYDGEIVLQESEISEGGFKTDEELRKMIEEEQLCPDDRLIVQKYLE